jgi:hypothetical protein
MVRARSLAHSPLHLFFLFIAFASRVHSNERTFASLSHHSLIQTECGLIKRSRTIKVCVFACVFRSKRRETTQPAQINGGKSRTHDYFMFFLSHSFSLLLPTRRRGNEAHGWEICGRFNLSCTRCVARYSFECLMLAACATDNVQSQSCATSFLSSAKKRNRTPAGGMNFDVGALGRGNSSCR